MERSVSENFLFSGEAVTGREVERSVSGNSCSPHRAGGGKIRLGEFPIPRRWKDPSGEAVTGLEADRSVSGFFYSQKKRSLGWRRKDPSRGISYSQEMERSVSKVSCSQERRSLGWRWQDPSRDFSIPRRGGHWVGGGKIRLGEFPIPRRWKDQNLLFPGEAVTGLEVESIPRTGGHWAGGGIYSQERRSPGWRREDPSRKIPHSQACSQERRSMGWRRKDLSRDFSIPRRGGHWVGGGKIRLGIFLFPGEAVTGLEAERSVSGNFLFPGDGKIRLENFLFPGEAVTGLEAIGSVSGILLG